METTPSNRSKRGREDLEVVAGNGLLHRRAFLRGGAAFAAAMTGYTLRNPPPRSSSRTIRGARRPAASSRRTACRRGSRRTSRAR